MEAFNQALTNLAPSNVDSTRASLLNVNPKLSRQNQRADYNPFGARTLEDKIGYGGAKPERIAKVRKDPAFSNMSDAEISRILSLGAPTRSTHFGRKGPSQVDKDALKQLATSHQVRIIPDLNSEATARTWLARKAAAARDSGNDRAATKWQNMITE
jgi:hypothetical protein